MKHNTPLLAYLLLIGSLSASMSTQAEPTESYGEIVGRKLANGLANITTGVVEIPKNIIIVNNQSNFAYGFVGGTFKGLLNMAGRMGVGIIDLISAPIPTYPIVYPNYVWEDFYTDTVYGPAMVEQQH